MQFECVEKNACLTAGFPKASDLLFLGLGPPNPLVAPLSGTLEGAKFWGIFECRRPSENSACLTGVFLHLFLQWKKLHQWVRVADVHMSMFPFFMKCCAMARSIVSELSHDMNNLWNAR